MLALRLATHRRRLWSGSRFLHRRIPLTLRKERGGRVNIIYRNSINFINSGQPQQRTAPILVFHQTVSEEVMISNTESKCYLIADLILN